MLAKMFRNNKDFGGLGAENFIESVRNLFSTN